MGRVPFLFDLTACRHAGTQRHTCLRNASGDTPGGVFMIVTAARRDRSCADLLSRTKQTADRLPGPPRLPACAAVVIFS
jgi:hypothetical protein